jgi:hypothetical protein
MQRPHLTPMQVQDAMGHVVVDQLTPLLARNLIGLAGTLRGIISSKIFCDKVL